MQRTTVMLPDELLAQLRYEARRRGTSVAELVREAVERDVSAVPGSGRGLSFFAVGEGGPPDASEKVDQYVAASVRRRHEERR